MRHGIFVAVFALSILLQEGGAFRAFFSTSASVISQASLDGQYYIYIPTIAFESDGKPIILPPVDQEPIPFGPLVDGESTYYYADGSGNCGFPASPDDLMVAALSTPDYDYAALCGSYIKVSGPKGDVVVRVVDRCPGCSEGHVDLSQEAFEQIADLSQGRVNVEWQQVSPPLQEPIAYHFMGSSSPWWMAIQLRNIRNPVAKFEYLDDDGSFVEVERVMWNYFVVYGGLGNGPYTFRVTDVFGRTITDVDVPLLDDELFHSDQQFPPPPTTEPSE